MRWGCSRLEVCSLLADEDRQVIEAVALVARDSVSVAMVRPWGDKQHLPAGTGIEHLPTWFPIWGEAILEQSDEGKTGLLNHVHHGFLTGADAGRYQHGAALCHHQKTGHRVLQFLVGHLAGAFHDHLVGAVEQEPVAHDGDVLVADHDVLLRFEELRVVTLGPQAARVVLQVLKHGVELPLALQDTVVIALFPEGRQCQFPSDTVAADLEAVKHMAQVARQSVSHLDDAVQVVGHQLQGEQSNLRIEPRHLAPARGDVLTQGRGIEPRLGVAVVGIADGAQ